MPQTRFVTRKALALGLKPIVVVNKIDRPGARAQWVVNQTFDLFDKLGATEEQLDFPVVYASALEGWATRKPDEKGENLKPLFEAILEYVPMRDENPDEPLQLQICSLDYSSYVGKIGIGRIRRGRIKAAQEVIVMNGPDSTPIKAKINQVQMFEGLERVQVAEAEAGDIVLINGIDEVGVGTTLCDPEHPDALPLLKVDEPTLTMNFLVNASPLAGREGKFVTSRQIRERLERETKSERRDARRVPRGHRHLHRARPRRAAPDDPAREHAPRRLRDRGVAAARDLQGNRRREAASRTKCSRWTWRTRTRAA